MTPERQNLETQLKSFEAAKKAAKGIDDEEFVKSARGIILTIREISKLPEDNSLTDFQVGSYCWALYAIAAKSSDGEESRQTLARLVCAYRKKIDNPQFWGTPKNADFGRTLFNSIVLQLYQTTKHANDSAAETLLKKVGETYLEILDLRAEAFLDDAAFHREPVTESQRAAMEKKPGKKIKMKAWPSIAEKAFGLMNRILKVLPEVKPSSGLVGFLVKNCRRGDWLAYYSAKALIRVGEYAQAQGFLMEMLHKKPKEGWLWSDLADACRKDYGVAVSCLAKALRCPNYDPQIAEGMAKKERALMGKLLQTLGRGPAPVDLKDAFYDQECKKAEVFVFGKEAAVQALSVTFEGKLIKHSGNAFGFVKYAKLGSVFIPPRFAEKHADGEFVKGKAQKKEDKKKKKLSWCMISAL